MRSLGNDIYIQRGETWSLDFTVRNDRGDPYMLFKQWENPYLVITVTAARYQQRGDFRQTWWLDMDNRWVEQADGTFEIVPMKRFQGTEALYITSFTPAGLEEALQKYRYIRLDADSDFDVTNYLFYTDVLNDGNRVYKYVDEYEHAGERIINATWTEYDFHIIKQFNTKDWTEQNYLFDVKVLAGESVDEHIRGILIQEGDNEELIPKTPWEDDVIQEHIKLISNKATRIEMQELFDSGAPLMPYYDTKSLVLLPTNLIVSANIQGGGSNA